MKSIHLVLFIFLFVLASYGQSGTKSRILAADNLSYSLTGYSDGKYIFSYENNISGEKDIREIIFRNKKDAKLFMARIGQSIHSKDGTGKMFSYLNYQVRLLTEIGGVFMMVNEKGQSRSAFRITDDIFKQLDIL